MKSDRLDYYRNQLRGVAVADLGRAAWAVLLEATQEAEREEREACAKVCADRSRAVLEQSRMVSAIVAMDECAAAIRARGNS